MKSLLAGTAMLAMGVAASADASACGGPDKELKDHIAKAQVEEMNKTSVAKALEGQGEIKAAAKQRCWNAPLAPRFILSSEATPKETCDVLKGVEAKTPEGEITKAFVAKEMECGQ